MEAKKFQKYVQSYRDACADHVYKTGNRGSRIENKKLHKIKIRNFIVNKSADINKTLYQECMDVSVISLSGLFIKLGGLRLRPTSNSPCPAEPLSSIGPYLDPMKPYEKVLYWT